MTADEAQKLAVMRAQFLVHRRRDDRTAEANAARLANSTIAG
jgi:hypothetical protein